MRLGDKVMPGYMVLILILLVAALVVFGFVAKYYRDRALRLRLSLSDTLHKKAELSNFMDLFSRNLRSVEEISEAMNLTARYVTDFINAKAVCIFVLEDDNYLHPTGIAGPFPPLHKSQDYVLTKPRYIMESLRHDKIKLGEGFVGEVALDGIGLLQEDTTNDPRFAAANKIIPVFTAIAVPMKNEGKIIGVICAINTQDSRQFTPEQFNSLNFMSSQVVLAHNIIKVYADLSKQQRLAQELEFARQLQHSLLPKDFPAWEPFVIHAITRSAKEVSGDFYDFVQIDANRLLVVVGDASGKGIPACMVMAMTRSFIRAAAERFTTLTDMLVELNRNLYRDTDEGRFATLSCCVLDKKERSLEFARAGHTELLIFAGEDNVRQICPNGAALGLLPGELADNFDTFAFSFQNDMSVMVFSDGLTESINPDGQEFGIENLKNIFHDSCGNHSTPQKCNEMALRAVDDFSAGQSQLDDQTIVIISHRDSFN